MVREPSVFQYKPICKDKLEGIRLWLEENLVKKIDNHDEKNAFSLNIKKEGFFRDP